MKKKLSLFLTLMLALIALFSFSVVGVSADNNEGWRVTAKNATAIAGDKVTIDYKLTHNGNLVDTLFIEDGSGNFYGVKPIVEIYQGTTKIADGNVIKTDKMSVGTKTLTLRVLDANRQQLGDSVNFKLTINKKDNTGVIMMVVLVVVIIGLFVWSSYSNRKKQKQAVEVANAIKIGDRVKTIGGVCGFVSEINNAENTFVLKVGEGSFVKFDKGAIYQTAPANVVTEVKEEVKQEVKEETPAPKAKKTNKKASEEKTDAEQ